jgi:hypothetical protein
LVEHPTLGVAQRGNRRSFAGVGKIAYTRRVVADPHVLYLIVGFDILVLVGWVVFVLLTAPLRNPTPLKAGPLPEQGPDGTDAPSQAHEPPKEEKS